MLKDCVSNTVLLDGVMCLANQAEIPQGATVIYDVLRVIDGVALFMEDHETRFFRSFELSGQSQPFARNVFADSINEFIRQTNLVEGNVRCAFSILGEQTQFVVYEIHHSYPTAQMYANGVACGTFSGERANPNVKQEAAVKTSAYQKIAETGVYEVLLVDSHNNVTEGSKSNMFFVQGDTVVTALAQDVLCGITRLQIIELIHSLDIPLVERKIALSELSTFQAAFISGTSPKVLPVNSIDSVQFNPQNAVVARIAQAYNYQISEYINSHK